LENAAYIALSRQTTLRRELDIVANNIANADTTGFKVEQLLLGTEPARPAKNDGVRGPANFVLDGQVGRDFSQGGLRQTGAPLDMAIEGEAFFSIAAPQGERYTRDGAFALDAQNRIVTAGGHPLLGEGGAEITLDPLRGQPSISADGIVSQEGQRVGKIAVVRFDALSVLEKTGDGLYSNTSNAQPQAAPDVRIRQGMLEQSNVKPIVEITKLVEISRAYESVARVVENANELSRRAVERLGRA
jgi:flagellar basal-body rod protein FlgF